MVARKQSSKATINKKNTNKTTESTNVVETPVENTSTPVVETPVVVSKTAKKSISPTTSKTNAVEVPDNNTSSSSETDSPSTSSDVDNKKIVESVVDEKTESIESVFLNKLSSFVNKIALINKEVKELQTMGKTLEKEFNSVVKVLSKQKTKSKNNENRALSGFAMPSLLSDELYIFLNIEKGTLIPRKDVTKLINEYIKSNELRNNEDKRKILPDASLKKIFNCGDEDVVTYFNLQTYMKHHFIKDQSVKPPVQIVVN